MDQLVSTRLALTRPPRSAIVRAGANCWHVDRADRFRCVQDADEYFRLLRQALLRARDTVFILGWDILAAVDLHPAAPPRDGAPTRLDELLAFIARRRPQLQCYVLIWDYAALYALERDPFSRWRLGWRMPRQIRFAFDPCHPMGGCHHQKIVVVDDRLAFCGGIDLTGHRWDTSAHRVDEPGRVSDGVAYSPYHEVQAMATGPIATSLGVLARDRWRAIGEHRLRPLRPSSIDPWPAGAVPDLTDVNVGIARTVPQSETQAPVRECEALFLDSIAHATHTLYIESQYFSNEIIGDAISARLKEPNGPEVVIVVPRECEGWLERNTMGAFRDSIFRRLIAADAHKRLRLVHPVASRSRNVPTFVHSKVMIVDDVLLRIGSANISRRSMGVDTECDLAVDAGDDPRVRTGIRRVRDRLLGEHLHLPADVIPGALARGSLRALIDARADAEHTLIPVELPASESALPDALRAAADPDEPVLSDIRGARAAIWITLGPALLLAAGFAALLRHVLLHPSASERIVTMGAALLLVAVATALRAVLVMRQVAPLIRGQRDRAEFG